MWLQDEQPQRGLRERKKAKTRAALQQHALRLFREQGYQATTVEQIAEAAEVSTSTFFRYFPTKEDVVLWDSYDDLLIAAFEAQPLELTPLQALRGALRSAFSQLPPDEMKQQLERSALTLTVPELRMRMLDQFAGIITVIAQSVARRVGRSPRDVAVRTFAGAVVGALLAVFFIDSDMLDADFDGTNNPFTDFIERMDASLAELEAGLPL